jgi:PilZ domain
MSSKETRRYRRIPYSGSVRVSWESAGGARFASGKCIDLSENGLRIELPVSIPPRTRVQLTTDRVGVAGSASVKNSERFGAKFIIGLEFTETLPAKVREALRDAVSV